MPLSFAKHKCAELTKPGESSYTPESIAPHKRKSPRTSQTIFMFNRGQHIMGGIEK